jgi:uncharacterized protein
MPARVEPDGALLALHQKEQQLAAWFRAKGSAVVAFSGGVDSAFLACVALDALGATNVLAIIGRSASFPAEQWQRAREVARRFGVPAIEVDTDEMGDQRYAANPSNRCYFCKSELWSKLVPVARERGLAVVVDGTNADDLLDHRPGRRAAAEQGVLSPLVELGFHKTEIRRLSQRRGIPTWSVPSSPCLSSRLPYGLRVTSERLRQVEAAEQAVRALGIAGNIRVRHHGDLARVELDPGVLDDWLAPHKLAALGAAVAEGDFARVSLDLAGFRSGSLNVLMGVP